MAEAFGADLGAVSSTARDLSDIRAQLAGIVSGIGSAGAATGSQKVAHALEKFVHNSSDNRAKLDELLASAADMLTSLVQGATELDTSLASGLRTPTGGPAPAPTPAPDPVPAAAGRGLP